MKYSRSEFDANLHLGTTDSRKRYRLAPAKISRPSTDFSKAFTKVNLILVTVLLGASILSAIFDVLVK